ncbi:hypothetical protein ACJVDH_05990 [Pedobacter sp. AW1-32]|uniref:hypothetical protein n=1 Tax=Pedobacter sp. AW1-32 TaxID=3383026 RepID=UPI003FEF31A5
MIAPYVLECGLASWVIFVPLLKRCVSRLSSSILQAKPWLPFSATTLSSSSAKKSALMISGWLYGLSAGNTSQSANVYNGNIVKQSWDWANTAAPTANVFNYGYDKLNRLSSASKTDGQMSEVLAYDVMGNIANLNRDGAGAKTYHYTDNHLNSVTDLTGVYGYNANGNATTDGRNGMALIYNYLNLPATASKTGTSLGLHI